MDNKVSIIIQRVSTKAVEDHESQEFNWCNTNNHRIANNDISDLDYNIHISKTAMSKWLPVLRPYLGPLRKSSEEITIPSLLLNKYFKPASDLAKVGAPVHRLFEEEFESCAVQMITNSENIKMIMDSTPKQGWFVRTASCSPKDADGGLGPHYTLKGILMAIAASKRCQKEFRLQNYQKDLIIYLSPFDHNARTSRELRVFVFERRITAISQYSWFDPNSDFSNMSNEKLVDVAMTVVKYHKYLVGPAWKEAEGIQSYVMDIEYINDTKEIFLIELNAFGAQFSAASCLFHWLRDKFILENHNGHQEVYFRVLSPNITKNMKEMPPNFQFF